MQLKKIHFATKTLDDDVFYNTATISIIRLMKDAHQFWLQFHLH